MNTKKLSLAEEFLVGSFVAKYQLENAVDVRENFSKKIDYASVKDDILYIAEATVSKTSSKHKSDGMDISGARNKFNSKYSVNASKCVVALLLPSHVVPTNTVQVAFDDNDIPIEKFDFPSNLKKIVKKVTDSASKEQRRKK